MQLHHITFVCLKFLTLIRKPPPLKAEAPWPCLVPPVWGGLAASLGALHGGGHWSDLDQNFLHSSQPKLQFAVSPARIYQWTQSHHLRSAFFSSSPREIVMLVLGLVCWLPSSVSCACKSPQHPPALKTTMSLTSWWPAPTSYGQHEPAWVTTLCQIGSCKKGWWEEIIKHKTTIHVW